MLPWQIRERERERARAGGLKPDALDPRPMDDTNKEKEQYIHAPQSQHHVHLHQQLQQQLRRQVETRTTGWGEFPGYNTV